MKKFIILSMLFFLSTSLFGCGQQNNNKSYNEINKTLSNVIETTKNNKEIKDEYLIIKGLINKETDGIYSLPQIYLYSPEEETYGNGYDGATFTGKNFFKTKTKHLGQLSRFALLKNKQQRYLINSLNEKIKDVQFFYKSFDNIKCNNNKKLVNEICNNISSNTKKIDSNKNNLLKVVKKISSLKKDYNKNIDILSLKYTEFINILNENNTYLKNISANLNNILIMNNNCKNKNDINIEKKKTNINTYENAYRKNYKNGINNYNRQYRNYPYNNYPYPAFNSPYYNSYNNYGGYIYNQFPYRNMPYFNQTPYSNYNPYFPNVNSYYGYYNIDTYKPIKEIENNNEETTENQDEEEYVKTSTKQYKNDKSLTKPKTKRYYTIAENDYLECKKILEKQKKNL